MRGWAKGIRPETARLTLARKITAITLIVKGPNKLLQPRVTNTERLSPRAPGGFAAIAALVKRE